MLVLVRLGLAVVAAEILGSRPALLLLVGCLGVGKGIRELAVARAAMCRVGGRRA